MKHDPEKHRRRSIRLKGYDYAQAGAYFVTVCAQNRECVFGKIADGKTDLNSAGKMAQQCWHEIPNHYPSVVLDEFVVMPNHIHGILMIENRDNVVGANNHSPLQCRPNVRANDYSPLQCHGTSKTIGAIIRGYKIGVTKWCRTNTYTHVVWQRNYYEHVIRDERSMSHIRQYIVNNPLQWAYDRENLAATSPEPEDAWRI